MSKSHVALEVTEMDAEDNVTEAMISVTREDEPDGELRDQGILMTPAEMDAVYKRLKVYYDQGIWSMGSVER